jgi:outer membrane protein OmpA-like peptidoglycan-associated protein
LLKFPPPGKGPFDRTSQIHIFRIPISMRAKRKSVSRYVVWPTLLLVLLVQRTKGQNLVPNPSFEDVNICSEFDQPCSPSAWFYLSRKFTTGYFPRYPSATGSRHLQMVAATRESPNRQYWETMLLCPLQAGARYTVSLKIAAPANRTDLTKTCPNLRDIGLWFTNRFVFVQGDSILQPRSYLSFTNASVTNLKNGWFELRKEFVPTSNATILIIGNFYRLSNADIMDQRNPPTPSIDILVDDLAVIPMNGAICPNAPKIKDSLYAIQQRHSKTLLPELDPDNSDTPFGDTSGRRLNNPTSIPPPEPDRTPDSPKTFPPATPAPVTDTIIIHNIQFDFDKYFMQNPDTLQRYRSLLTKPGIKKIQVVGYTDDAGSAAYNLDLSQKRALEVAREIASRFDIPPALIETEGRGISTKYPAKSLNRRVEIYILHD